MSLCRIALRISAVEALRGRTTVGDNVLDSPNGAIDIGVDGSFKLGQKRPFISVFTDQSKKEGVSGRSLFENGLCDIVFEMGISMPMVETNRMTGESTLIGFSIPASDRSIEFSLDIIQRQIADALGDPDNPWAEIYRELHYGVSKIEFAGARSTDEGQKLAGHQIRITVNLADDPIKGEQLAADSAFRKFLTALEASEKPEYLEYAGRIREILDGSSDPTSILRFQHGMTRAEVEALGLEVLDDASPGAPLDRVTIEVEGRDSIIVE